MVVLPPRLDLEPLGTPLGYTRSSAGTTQGVLPAQTSEDTKPQGTPGAYSIFFSLGHKLLAPETEAHNNIDQ